MTTLLRKSLIKAEQPFSAVRTIDRIFWGLTAASATALALILVAITAELVNIAVPAMQTFGFKFLLASQWNPVENTYGILPQIYGTLVSSAIALILAVPLGIGVAIFLSENFLPNIILIPTAFLIELLAAIPSVVYGLWGIFVFIPATVPFFEGVHHLLGWLPLFGSEPTTRAMLPTGIVLAIMILPTIVAISRDTLLSVPPQLRQGAMALGATRWEAILGVILPSGLSGIVGSIMLALGRALGETMATAMLIGNANRISVSLFEPASTIASLIANQFSEASGLQVSSLLYAGLVLMVLTLLVNIVAEVIISRFQQVE